MIWNLKSRGVKKWRKKAEEMCVFVWGGVEVSIFLKEALPKIWGPRGNEEEYERDEENTHASIVRN